MKYRIFNSDRVLESDNSLDVIESVKNNSIFTSGMSIDDYIKNYRKRYFRVNYEIITNDYDDIIKSMIENKIIEVLEE
jgi:hypothetical protein